MVFTINVTNTSGDVGTIEPDAGFSYTDQLNRINQASLRFSGLGVIRKGLLEAGSKIEILRNGTREFFGLVQEINFLSGGAVVVNVPGFEVWLALENGAYAGSPWTATASATIASAIIGESSEFTAGTVEAGSSIDFRVQNTDSLYNALSNLVRKTQQNIGIDYPNLEIDVLDHKGSSTSVATLNAGIEISNVRIDQFFPRGNIIRVVGSSEGQTKITGLAEDATSKSAFGNITLVIRDRTVSTTAEANLLADAELAISKDPIKVYDFDVNNFDLSIVSGDVLTLNARSQGISAESVRTVGVERGVQGSKEFMTLQVTNTEYSRSLKRRNELVTEIEKASRQNEDYDQFDGEYSNQTVASNISGHPTTTATIGNSGTDYEGQEFGLTSGTTFGNTGTVYIGDRIGLGASPSASVKILADNFSVSDGGTTDLGGGTIGDINNIFLKIINKQGAGDIDIFDNVDMNDNSLYNATGNLNINEDALGNAPTQFGANASRGGTEQDVEIYDDCNIDGVLSKGSGTFKINHPSDPENKYLHHSFVESPEMRNEYYGQVQTVGKKAVVQLPDWWHALNGTDKSEFNYQLTSIGIKTDIWISKEVENGEFEISTSTDCKVSWKLSAIRHDKFAEENRIQVETNKNTALIEKFPSMRMVSDLYEYDEETDMTYKIKKKDLFFEKKPFILQEKICNTELKQRRDQIKMLMEDFQSKVKLETEELTAIQNKYLTCQSDEERVSIKEELQARMDACTSGECLDAIKEKNIEFDELKKQRDLIAENMKECNKRYYENKYKNN